jgi:catechol 2,3-dioxygenase-like lactoylglutathione lyase family enzyme
VQPLGVHHVALVVDDVDEALRFYTKTLGLTVRDDRPDFGMAGAWLDAGSQQLHLIEGAIPSQKGQHFALLFENLDAVIEQLRTEGLDVGDPFATAFSKQTIVKDPAGNMVELHQRL